VTSVFRQQRTLGLVNLFGIPGRPGRGGNAQLTIKGTLTVASGTVPSPPTVYAWTMIE
jgi:hypothetical protein